MLLRLLGRVNEREAKRHKVDRVGLKAWIILHDVYLGNINMQT